MNWMTSSWVVVEAPSMAIADLRLKELRQAFTKKGICIHLRPRNYALL
jgi:hypothetical protein